MTRPCTCEKPTCHLCKMAKRPEYVRLWIRGNAVCKHEGLIAEPAACNCDEKHVRNCLHVLAEHDLCTRGPNNGTVASCATCKLWERENG